MSTTSRILTIAAFLAAFLAAIVVAIALLRPPAERSSEQSLEAPTSSEADPAPRSYRPTPVSQEARLTVDDILERHRGMSKQELEKSVELNELMNRFITLLNTPEMAAKIEERIAAFPPGEGAGQGMIRMDFDMYDDARGRAWLEAAVSNDAQRMEAWLLNTLDGAVFEFAFDHEMEKTSDGVSLQRSGE